jgi:hypothetical protein
MREPTALPAFEEVTPAPRLQEAHRRLSTALGVLLPCHGFIERSRLLRIVSGGFTLTPVLWVPDVATHHVRASGRVSQWQPDLAEMLADADRYRAAFTSWRGRKHVGPSLPADIAPGSMVIAPSGSGKTWFCEHQPHLFEPLSLLNHNSSTSDTLYVDGDAIVPWPKTPFFWRSMNNAQLALLAYMHFSVIGEYLTHVGNRGWNVVVLFNGGGMVHVLGSRPHWDLPFYLPYHPARLGHWCDTVSFGLSCALASRFVPWGSYLGLFADEWHHMTRGVTAVMALYKFGWPGHVRIERKGGYISAVYVSSRTAPGQWFEIFVSGHLIHLLLNAWLPDLRGQRTSRYMWSVMQQLAGMRANQRRTLTTSFEPTQSTTAWHSPIDYLAAIYGALSVICWLRKRGCDLRVNVKYAKLVLYAARRLVSLKALSGPHALWNSPLVDRRSLRNLDGRFGS